MQLISNEDKSEAHIFRQSGEHRFTYSLGDYLPRVCVCLVVGRIQGCVPQAAYEYVGGGRRGGQG